MCHANNEKRKTTNDRRNGTTKSTKNQNARRKGNLQILENMGSRHHQTSSDEKKIKVSQENKKKTKNKLLENKLYCKNLIKGINTWAVPLVGYSRPFLKRTKEELQQMNQRTRKLMTMHKALHLCCNGYRRRKWTRRHEFKSWTRLIAFHIALISLGKVWIQLFSLQLWVNSRAD